VRAGYATWSADGSRLAIGTDEGGIVVTDADCTPLLTMSGSHSPSTAQFTPDGATLFARGPEGTRQFDLTTGRQIGAVFPDPNGNLPAYGLTAGGELLTMADVAHQLLLVAIDPAQWFAQACAITGRNLTRDEWQRYLSALGPYQPSCPQRSGASAS
jgi:hypothetical protein